MSPEQFIEMMNELPDDIIVSANRTRFRRRGSIRYLIPALAACLLIGMTALLYAKFRTGKPERTDPSASVTEASTTAGTDSTSGQFSGTPAGTTDADSTSARTADTQTTENPSVTEQTSAVSAGTSDTVPSASRTTDSAQRTKAGTLSAQTTVTTAQTDASGSDATAPEGNETGARDETGASEAGYAEMSVPFSILSQRTVAPSEEPLPFTAQAALYRNNLPDEYPAADFPVIDFAESDCLVIRFRTTGSDDGAEMISGSGMFYGIRIIPPAAAAGTVQEYVIAAVIPKALYSPASPDGINRWLRWELPVPAGTEMQCLLLTYE